MGIYIKGMEMPKGTEGTTIFAIRPDGMVEDVMGCYIGKAIPVPDHGRLIDADDKINQLKTLIEQVPRPFQEVLYQYAIDLLERCPTVIPASEEGKT